LRPIDLHELTPEVAFVVGALRARYGGDVGQAGQPDPGAALDLMRRHAVEPVVLDALEATGRAMPDAIELPLRDAVRATKLANLEATAELIRVLDLLDTNGIRALPYKGPVLAVATYGDLGLRRFVDLDVLIEREHVLEALDLLEADGYAPAYSLTPRQLRATLEDGHDRKLVKHDRHVLEIQWAIADATNRLPRSVTALMDRATSVSIAGRDVPTLATNDLLVVLAIHGSLHLWERLAWVCDVAEALRVAVDLDADAVLRLAGGAGARRMLLLAVAMVAVALDAVPSPELLRAADADPKVPGLVDALTPLVFGDGPHAAPARTQLKLSMGLTDVPVDGLRKAWRSMTTPSVSDWKSVPLPDALWPLYYPVRLARLATSYVLGNRRPGDLDVLG
jgi:hypothetical protein